MGRGRDLIIPAARVGGISARRLREDDGSCRLELEFVTRFESSRPVYWDTAPDVLRQHGFELQPDPFSGEEEWFVPTTLFSADAALIASKRYPGEAADQMLADLDAIARRLGLGGEKKGLS
jgi:hypothetical protein